MVLEDLSEPTALQLYGLGGPFRAPQLYGLGGPFRAPQLYGLGGPFLPQWGLNGVLIWGLNGV